MTARVFWITTAIVMTLAANALGAGRGTIIETDTQIIVEYTDDPVETKTEPPPRQEAPNVQQVKPAEVNTDERPAVARLKMFQEAMDQREAQKKQKQSRRSMTKDGAPRQNHDEVE